MPPSQDPMVARRRLRDALRRLREEAQLTQKAVADEMEWSLSKLIRIESGNVGISTNDLRVLLPHYGASDEYAQELLELSREARRQAWWSPYRNIMSPAYRAFLGYESSARLIRNFQPQLVPGLLQTADYARAVFEAVGVTTQLEERIQLRLQRMETLLERSEPPELHFIVDQVAITRVVGGAGVMRRQLEELRRFAEHPRITLRVVPWKVGLYPNFRAAYVLFELEEDEPNVLYQEQPNGDLIVVESVAQDEPNRFLEAFWETEALAPAEETDRLLAEAMAGLG